MAGLKILVAVVAVFAIKDGALSCSLRSHKSGSSLFSTSDTDSTLIRHHTATHKLHKSTSPCDSSSISSSSSSSVLPGLQNVPPTFFTPISDQSSTASSNYNQEIVNLLSKFLSSCSTNITSTSSQTLASFLSVPPSGSSPVGSLPSGSSSSVLPNLTSGSASPSSGILVPELQWPGLTPTSTSLLTPSVNSDLQQMFQQLSQSVSKPKPLPLPPLHPLFIPSRNINPMPVPILKQHKISYPTIPLSGLSSHSKNALSNLPCGSSTKPKYPVSNEVLEPVTTQATETIPISGSSTVQDFKSIPAIPPEAVSKLTPKFPSLLPLPTPIPSHSGHGSDLINLFFESLSNLTTIFNMTSIPASVTRPPTNSSSCTTPFGSNSNASNISSSQPCDSIVPQKLIPVTPLPISEFNPTLTSDISYGYNPSSLNLLYKHFLSNSSLAGLNTTMVSPSISNVFPTNTSNESLPNLNSDLFNVLPNLSTDLSPTLANFKNITNNNNEAFKNALSKLLLHILTDSKIANLPPISMTSLNTTTFPPNLLPKSDPYTPSFDSSSDSYSTLTNPTSGSIQSSVSLNPVSVTPSPVRKTFPDTVLGSTSPPNPCRSNPSLDLNPCRLKHSRPSHLPGSIPLGATLCQKNVSRSLTPHSSSPFSLNPSKLSTGCKH